MGRFPCPKCLRDFDRKFNLDTHLNKKFDCNKKINIDNIIHDDLNDNSEQFKNIPKPFQNIPKPFQNIPNIPNTENFIIDDLNNKNICFCCGFCSKFYSSKSNLNKHSKNCKIKKENENDKEKIFKLLLEKDKENKEKINKLEKQNKLLMEKIDKLISMKCDSKQSKTINNISNTLNDNSYHTQNNFVMVNFGKEDLSVIDEKLFIDRIIKKNTISGVKIPDEVLKIIHFNPIYPQLSNIYISDINREKCMVYDDGEWKLSNIDNIPLIMDKICLFSSDQINNLRKKYPNNKTLTDRLNVIEKYNNMIDEDHIQDLRDDEDNYNKSIIERCENFKKNTYDTLKKTLYNEGKKIKKNTK